MIDGKKMSSKLLFNKLVYIKNVNEYMKKETAYDLISLRNKFLHKINK